MMRTLLALIGIVIAGLLLLSGIAFVKSPEGERNFGPLNWLAALIVDDGPDESPGLPMPHNGAQKIYSNQLLSSDDPTFTIHNTKSPLYCFVKLEDARTGKVAGEFFVHPKKKVATRMINGKFRIKVAYGNTWHGREKLFGRKTEVFQYNNAVEFQAIPVGGASVLSRWGVYYTRPGYISIGTNVKARRSKGETNLGSVSKIPSGKW